MKDMGKMQKTEFSSKANVLKFLSTRVKKSKIEKLFEFTYFEWKNNPENILEKIRTGFSPEKIIVRSSALGEDSESSSQAGNFETVANVDSNSSSAIRNSIKRVFESYNTKGEKHDKNQILIQYQTKKIISSGVIFTRTPDIGSPYYVINYEDGFSTDGVTKGQVGNTIKIFRNIKKSKIPKKWISLIESVREIEKILGNDFLDIEFGITNNVVIFQVRPITSIIDIPTKNTDKKIIQALTCCRENLNQSIKKNKIRKNQIIFSDMSDWNPAEIIGNNPNLLDYSLYDYLIMNEIWHSGRRVMGYRDMKKSPLMNKFGNKPYVNVKASMESLIPTQIPKKLQIKLLNFYLKKLHENPHLHDKIEFEIVFSCYDFNLKERLKELEKNGFNKKETKSIENILKKFTNEIFIRFKNFETDSYSAIQTMNRNRLIILRQLNDSKQNVQELICAIEKLLLDCRKYGTYYFSTMARIGFIGNILLKSLAKNNYLEKKHVDLFLNSIESPLSEIQDDLILLKNKKISKKKFLNKYGHLRPGTYDITASRYDKNKGFFENIKDLKKSKKQKSYLPKSLTKILHNHEIQINQNEFSEFIRESLILREKLKFEFTQNLSDALELIAKIAEKLKVTREEIAQIDIDTILNSKKLSQKELKQIISRKIMENSDRKEINDYLVLPPIIFNDNDFHVLEYRIAKPNFISSKKIIEEVIILKKSIKKIPELTGKIVAIENADPGYDWIFSKNPAALITKYGGVASHMAIRCAEIGLPAAIGTGELIFENLHNKSKINLDCQNETIIIMQDKSEDPYFKEKQVLKSLGYIR